MELAPQQLAVRVDRRTHEWGWLEHHLHVSCLTSKLRLRAAWSVANKRVAVEYDQRCRGLLQLHAWVPVSELPAGESVDSVCRSGFRMGHAGVSFHIGNIQLPGLFQQREEAERRGRRGDAVPRPRGRNLPAGRRLYEFLLCRVGIGRPFLVEGAARADVQDLPPEYDSIFVRHDPPEMQGVDGEYPGVLPRHVLHHEYIVRDASQALAVYLVHFEYDPEIPERLALPLCDNCGMRAALLYCEADDAALCRECDSSLHTANSIAARHVRVDVNRRPGAPHGQCPDHPDVEADRMCVECQLPLCIHCRNFGSHSGGQAASHKSIGLKEAYEHALRARRPTGRTEGESAAIPDRAHVEQRLVPEIDSKLAAVQSSTRATEDQIYNHVQQAVQQGQVLAEEQASFLLSDELEAKRQLEQAAWLEAFLEEKVKVLPPADFLDAWLQHCSARAELVELGQAAIPERTSAGLRVEGGLQLLVDHRGGDGKGIRSKGGKGAPSPHNPDLFLLDG